MAEGECYMERNYYREGYESWYEGYRYRPNDPHAYDEFMRGVFAAYEEEYQHRLETDRIKDRCY